jgi:hypothetical protein
VFVQTLLPLSSAQTGKEAVEPRYETPSVAAMTSPDVVLIVLQLLDCRVELVPVGQRNGQNPFFIAVCGILLVVCIQHHFESAGLLASAIHVRIATLHLLRKAIERVEERVVLLLDYIEQGFLEQCLELLTIIRY